MTHANVDRDDLFLEVGRFVQKKFPDGVISRVDVRDSVDEQGERILEITAVFEGSPQDFADIKPRGLIRMLRDKLADAHDFAFPMLSFVSAQEARS